MVHSPVCSPLKTMRSPIFPHPPPPPFPIPCGKYWRKKLQPLVQNNKKKGKKLAESSSVSIKLKWAWNHFIFSITLGKRAFRVGCYQSVATVRPSFQPVVHKLWSKVIFLSMFEEWKWRAVPWKQVPSFIQFCQFYNKTNKALVCRHLTAKINEY